MKGTTLFYALLFLFRIHNLAIIAVSKFARTYMKTRGVSAVVLLGPANYAIASKRGNYSIHGYDTRFINVLSPAFRLPILAACIIRRKGGKEIMTPSGETVPPRYQSRYLAADRKKINFP